MASFERQTLGRMYSVPSILYVIGSMNIGGAEMQLYQLSSAIHLHDFKCYIFALQSQGPLKKKFESQGIEVFGGGLLPGDLSTAPWKILPALNRLINCIKKARPRVIHSFLPLITCMGALAGRLCKVDHIVTSKRALGFHQERYPFLKLLDRIANQFSHVITVNSQAVGKDCIKRDHVDPKKIALIHNGICIDPYLEQERDVIKQKVRNSLFIDPGDPLLICIANLIPYKGHVDLLQAARIIVDAGFPIKFLFAGEDRNGFGRQLKSKSIRLGLDRHIFFLGQCHNTIELLTASDISVLASHEEGFSNVLLESMAAGLPVVATHVGGNPEAVLNGVTGWLVPPKCPELLAEKIIDLLKDPHKSKQWGLSGRQHVQQQFSLQKMVDRQLRLYRSMLSLDPKQ
jgi:glycosyltransferase involved in cell wall biosynthesis